MKQKLFQLILQQDMTYFDYHKTGELNSVLTNDMGKIRAGIGDQLGLLISTLSKLTCGIILCEYKFTVLFLSANKSRFDSGLEFNVSDIIGGSFTFCLAYRCDKSRIF